MPGTDEKFLKRLLTTFQAEAREHIQAISSGLVDLENASTEEVRTSTLETIFRAAHSLKGAARAVNSRDVETVLRLCVSAGSGSPLSLSAFIRPHPSGRGLAEPASSTG